MKPALIFIIGVLTLCLPALSQDKYQLHFSNKILAPKIPSMDPRTVESKFHPVTYQKLKSFSLVRVKSAIFGTADYNPMSVGKADGSKPQLRFPPRTGSTQFRPGDWLRILSVKREDPIAEIELDGTKVGFGGFSDARVYSMIALKMSPDFKTSEFYLLHALANPDSEIAEFEVFNRDVTAGVHELHLNEVKAGDVVISASEMKFGKHNQWLSANTPLVVESVKSKRQPFRFVWKYTLKLRIINCPREFKSSNCRGTYSDEYMRRPTVFMGKVRMPKF